MADQPRTYPSGVPCWVDVEADDVDAASRFYGELFGWTFERVTPPQAPPYLVATLDGADVAGLGHGRSGWSTYVAVADADEAVARVRAAGGRVTEEPADAGAAGRSASCADPAGVPFRVWQPGHRRGVQVANVPNAWNFSNLTGDAPESAFYRTVFGWGELDAGGFSTFTVPGYGEHLHRTVDPDIFERQAQVHTPEGFADVVAGRAPRDGHGDRWAVTFTVADRDAAASRIETLGGTVLDRADTGWTRIATATDRDGAVFTVSQFTPPGGS